VALGRGANVANGVSVGSADAARFVVAAAVGSGETIEIDV